METLPSFSQWKRCDGIYGLACVMLLHMCIRKMRCNYSLAIEKTMPTLPWSVCGVCMCAFSVCYFLSCCAINSGECYCLSYFMCHWLPQSLMKNVHCICKQSLFVPAFLLVSTFSLFSPPSKDLSSPHPAML